jgi:hypothetical protein
MDADALPTPPDNAALVRDLVQWVAAAPRRYEDVMQAWRSTCPRLTIWEDACELGLVRVGREPGQAALLVTVTPEGRAFLRRPA